MTLKKRLAIINAMPDDTLFYFQSYGFIGNAIQLWGLGSKGYTTDPAKAQTYTKSETIDQLKCGRDQDNFWTAESVKNATRAIVDFESIDNAGRI